MFIQSFYLKTNLSVAIDQLSDIFLISFDSAKHMSSTSDRFAQEFGESLQGFSPNEIGAWAQSVIRLMRRFAIACEMDGPIFLVPDNNIIQDFKHQNKKLNRRLRALSYKAFCRFVTGWSHRKTYIAVSAATIYEHLGRKVPSRLGAQAAFDDIHTLLKDACLPICGINFSSGRQLHKILKAVDADAIYLKNFLDRVNSQSWRRNLKLPYGVRIPLSIAHESIPSKLPLRYFDPWYVRFAFGSHIERLIVDQSQGDPTAAPIHSGELSDALVALNKVCRRRDILVGLGDLDLLQICDFTRQYSQRSGYIMHGQTFDDDLLEVLRLRSTMIEGRGIVFGKNDTEAQINEF